MKCPVEQFLNRAKFDRCSLLVKALDILFQKWKCSLLVKTYLFYPVLTQQLSLIFQSLLCFWEMTNDHFFQKQCLHWLPICCDWALSSWGTFGTVAGGTNRPWYNLTKTARALLLPSVWYLFDTPFLCWPDMNNIKVTLFYDFLGRERRPKWESEKGRKRRESLWPQWAVARQRVICLKFAN